LAKFLWVLIPVFLCLALPGLDAMVRYELRDDRDTLAARMGNLAARTAFVLSRHDIVSNPQLGRDLMAPLAADRAFLCAELTTAIAATPLIALPQGLGCRGGEDGHHVRIPVGQDGAMLLLLRFSNAEIAASRAQRRNIVFAVVIVSILCAVVAATIGFRFIVGGPLRKFLAAIQAFVETGKRTKVDISRNDELGHVIAAFDDMLDRDEKRESEKHRAYNALMRSKANLRRLNEELEQRVASRTAELESEKVKAQADRDYLGAVLETVADAIVTTNNRGEIRSVNRATEQLFGYRGDEIVKSEIGLLIPSQLGRPPLASTVKCRPAGNIRMGDGCLETKGRRKDGLEFPLEVLFSEMRYAGEDIHICVLRDVTERQDSQRRLIAAKDDAETANRAKSLFLANMSHELRTPLNAVLGFSEAMQAKIQGPLGHKRYDEYVDGIHASGEHLLHLINTILDFSKIEAGAETLDESELLVCDLVDECVRMVRRSSKDAGVQLRTDAVDDSVVIRADHTKMVQILVNLLSNAVKFTPAGGEVELRVGYSAGSHLVFSIIDTGIGMTSDQVPLALSRFGQLDNSFARRFEGTGLGCPWPSRLRNCTAEACTSKAMRAKGQPSRSFCLPPAWSVPQRRNRMLLAPAGPAKSISLIVSGCNVFATTSRPACRQGRRVPHHRLHRQNSLFPMTRSLRPVASFSLLRLFPMLVSVLIATGVPVGAGQANDYIARDCIDQLGDPGVDIIACTVPFELKERARDDLIRITGGVVRDAGCLLEVGLERATLFNALVHAEDLVVPAQPVECDVETDRQPLQARFTLAPKVWFADGRAVGATPGMANVRGLPPLLALLLTKWVNTNPQVQRAMVAWVNNYLANGLR